MPGINFVLQDRFLEEFFSSQFAGNFNLTGGTALSRFYLFHRESIDLDLFTHDQNLDFAAVSATVQAIGKKLNLSVYQQVTTEAFLQFIFLAPDKTTLKTDFVKDISVRFGEIETKGKIRLDSLENIAVNKVLAVFGRTDAKDFIDLYFLLKNKGFILEDLIEKAKKKDLGLSEFYLANSVAAIENVTQWPQVLLPLDKNKLMKFYQDLSQKLLLKIKPK